jgi:hypothetical protein
MLRAFGALVSVRALAAILAASASIPALAQGLPPGMGAAPGMNLPLPPGPSAPSAPSAPAPAALSAVKRPDGGGMLGGQWYGTLELRHHINTFYDKQGYYHHQEPSLHARVQAGAQFYSGMVDAYLTFGVYKLPQTQQVLQRRPELALDFYPVRTTYFTLLQYNLIQMPYDQTQQDPESDEDTKTGTVYTLGVAPTGRLPFNAGSTKIELKAGLDGWTRLYSRQQYVEGQELGAEDEGDESRLGLDDAAEEPAEPIEDYALHYRHEAMAGFSVQPGFLPGLTGEATTNYHSSYDPVYTRNEETGAVSYDYGVERHSYYRIRLAYAVTDRITIMNDFYNFFDGFYAGKREGVEREDRRFRNIARVMCRL